MKKFVDPEMEIEKFEMADVITASGCDWDGDSDCANFTGWA